MNPRYMPGCEQACCVPRVDASDEWISEWATMGLAEMGRWLAVQAAFADYCRKRDAR